MNLLVTRRDDRPARYFADGRRISRDCFETIQIEARMYGRIECFWTRSIFRSGHTLRRHGSVIVEPSSPRTKPTRSSIYVQDTIPLGRSEAPE
jgi:hypothetical protein